MMTLGEDENGPWTEEQWEEGVKRACEHPVTRGFFFTLGSITGIGIWGGIWFLVEPAEAGKVYGILFSALGL